MIVLEVENLSNSLEKSGFIRKVFDFFVRINKFIKKIVRWFLLSVVFFSIFSIKSEASRYNKIISDLRSVREVELFSESFLRVACELCGKANESELLTIDLIENSYDSLDEKKDNLLKNIEAFLANNEINLDKLTMDFNRNTNLWERQSLFKSIFFDPKGVLIINPLNKIFYLIKKNFSFIKSLESPYDFLFEVILKILICNCFLSWVISGYQSHSINEMMDEKKNKFDEKNFEFSDEPFKMFEDSIFQFENILIQLLFSIDLYSHYLFVTSGIPEFLKTFGRFEFVILWFVSLVLLPSIKEVPKLIDQGTSFVSADRFAVFLFISVLQISLWSEKNSSKLNSFLIFLNSVISQVTEVSNSVFYWLSSRGYSSFPEEEPEL